MVGMVMVALLAAGPEAAGGAPWTQVVDGDMKVFVREVPGQRVKEIRGEKTMAATAAEVREVLTDDEYSKHAAYVGEWRTISHDTPNTWVRYTRLSLPVVDDRDYFIEITRESDLAADGTGVFKSTWKPWGLDRPTRDGVVRVTTNSGYWEVKPSADGLHADVTYYLSFDPGGSIPGWAVERGNKSVLPNVLKDLEKEAIRRHEMKLQAQK